jgi:hypothetical protein
MRKEPILTHGTIRILLASGSGQLGKLLAMRERKEEAKPLTPFSVSFRISYI